MSDNQVTKLINDGVVENVSDTEAFAKEAVAHLATLLVPETDKAEIAKATKNVFTWLATQPVELQYAAVKHGLGKKSKLCISCGLNDVSEFTSVIHNIKDKLGDQVKADKEAAAKEAESK